MKEGTILIGWAEKDLTPHRRVNLAGQFHIRISEYVNDPVKATVLAISNGEEQVVFVSCDTVAIPLYILKRVREEVKEKVPDLDPDKIILNATHTHTAPDTSDEYGPLPADVMKPSEYREFFVERVVEGIMEAWNNKGEGEIAWGLGCAVVGHNRRVVYFDDLSKREGYAPSWGRIVDGTASMYGNVNDPNFSHIEGYVDHYIDMLFTYDKAERLRGMVINLACPSQETEGESYISADFWNEIRTEIRGGFGEDIFILAQCSSAGDQSPHRLLYKDAEDRMLKLKGISMRQEIGRRVASAVGEVLPYVQKDKRGKVILKHIVKEINLKKRFVTDEEWEIAKQEYERLKEWQPQNDMERSVQWVSMGRCLKVMERYERQKAEPYFPMELHVIRLGDIAFATNCFELFLDYGLRIKVRSPAVQTFLVQLCAGLPGAFIGGYLPTERAVSGKGYSANVYDNLVGPEGGQQLVEETVKALRELWCIA